MARSTQGKWFFPFLPQTLWEQDGARRRSVEATPLYVDRYLGPRTASVATSHDFWELSFVFSGHGMLQARQDIALFPNAAVLTPPGLGHREKSVEMMDTLWVGYTGSRLRDLDHSDIVLATCPDLAPWCEQLWNLASEPVAASGAELDGLAQLIVGHVLRTRGRPGAVAESVIEDSVHHIREHSSRPLSIRRLAHRSGFSEGHFHRSFRKHTGMTPHAFIERERVRQAIRWLSHTAEPIKRIARRVGYEDPLYFSRAFKKAVGVSPREFRRKGFPDDEGPTDSSSDLQRTP